MMVLYELVKMYYQCGWMMQLYFGVLCNNNGCLLCIVGIDVGCDSIGDFLQVEGLLVFFNCFDQEEKLMKMIFYNFNLCDNEVFVIMAGNFNEGLLVGKIQWGLVWWFFD